MKAQRLPTWATIAGIAVGLGFAIGLVTFGVLTIPARRDLRDASADFLTAWDRSRTGTFVVDSDFRRRLGDGRTLFSQSRLAQRPPDRIIRQFGGIEGTINGHLIVCSTDQGGHFSCFAGNTATGDYTETVQRELDVFRSYFAEAAPAAASATSSSTRAPNPGSTPSSGGPGSIPQLVPLGLYRVGYAPEGGCFEFFQLIRYPDAPYGSYAKFCFDSATGAMRSIERHLARDVIETMAATSIESVVSPTDLDTEQDRSFDQRMDLGEFDVPTVPPASTPTEGPTATRAPPVRALATQSNADLITQGSVVIADRVALEPFVDEALRRLTEGSLSVNDEAWVNEGQPRALLNPVIFRMLGLGIYLPA